jgi:signal transduction histidine kinase
MGERRTRTADVCLAVLATAVQLLGLREGQAVRPPEALTGVSGGVLLSVAVLAQGMSLLWRRRRPVSVLAVCLAGYAVNAAVVPGVLPWAGWAALYAAGVYARPGRRAGYVVMLGAFGLLAVIGLGALAYPTAIPQLVLLALVTVIVALLATLVRSRRAQMDALRERAAALERERESAVARAAVEERLRIAREVHDLVGHGLSGIAVQSSTARLALDAGRLDQAREALAAVESSSRDAMTEMRYLLGLLRGDETGGYDPAPGVRDLAGLVDRLRARGVPVTLSTDGLAELPEAASLGAYRVVQEALTNVVKHAPGGRVTVDVTASDGVLIVVVEDYAEATVPPAAHGSGGMGLAGMRERVAALGGELSVGPAPDHPGWQVRATIPYRGRSAR